MADSSESSGPVGSVGKESAPMLFSRSVLVKVVSDHGRKQSSIADVRRKLDSKMQACLGITAEAPSMLIIPSSPGLTPLRTGG